MKLPIEQLPEIQSADFNQYHLNWRSSGKGEAVVLLHGISSGSASWIHQLTDLSLTKNYQLLAWDAPGYLNSRPLATKTPTAMDYANALEELLNGQGFAQVTVVGHSLGAIIASAFASAHPDRVKGLFLANPAQGYATKNQAEQNRVYEQRQEIVFNTGIEAYAQQRAAALLSPSAHQSQIDWARQTMGRLQPDGFLAAAWMLAHDDISRYLNSYLGPVQMVVGNDDTITPPEKVYQLAQQKGCPLTYIPQSGHASYLDAPQQFNHYLQQFLANHTVKLD